MITLISTTAFAATQSWGSDDGTVIATGQEFSGAVWDETSETLYSVHDNGYLLSMNADGSDFESTYLGGDLEGITIVPGREGYLYVVVEHPDTIKEIYDGVFTGKQWTLTSWMTGDSNRGAESLTWIPSGEHGIAGLNEGVFAAGLQADGKFYVFSVDFETSESVTFHETFSATYAGSPMVFDLSGSHYDIETQTMYAIYDAGYNVMATLQLDDSGDWETVAKYSLPGDNEEGVAIIGPGTVILAEDSGELYSYTNWDLGYPEEEEEVIDVDTDGDGLLDSVELGLGTDPNVRDTDGDTFNDAFEVARGTDPLDFDDRVPELVNASNFIMDTVSITLASGREYSDTPFASEENSEIIYTWTNSYNRVLYATNGYLIKGFINGEVIKEMPMYNWRIDSYELISDTEVEVVYNSGYTVTIEPFADRDSTEITQMWTNVGSRALYVGNADNEGIGYKNGFAYKEFTVNPRWFIES